MSSRAFEKEKHGYNRSAVDAYIAETNAAAEAQMERIAGLKKELEEKDAELLQFKQKQELIVKSIMSAAEKAEQIEQLIKQKFTAEMEHLSAFHQQWTEYYKKLIETYPLSSELGGLSAFNRRMSAILTGDDQPQQKFAQAREQFEEESTRLKKKYIGFIPVDEDSDVEAYGDLPPDFDPEESIRQMLRRQISEESAGGAKQTVQNNAKKKPAVPARGGAKPVAKPASQPASKSVKKGTVAATANPAVLGQSDNGFSFEEALNPTQGLSDILKEIGLKLGD